MGPVLDLIPEVDDQPAYFSLVRIFAGITVLERAQNFVEGRHGLGIAGRGALSVDPRKTRSPARFPLRGDFPRPGTSRR
jgi:hypothetical protein